MATATEQMVFELITENTGQHFLDSGMANNRHWQRNQKVPIEAWIESAKVKMSPTTSRSGGWFDVTINLFHHLVDNLDYEEYLDKLFHRFVDMYIKNWYEYWDEGGYEYRDYNPATQEWVTLIKQPYGYGDFSWDKAMKAFHELITNGHRKGNRKYNTWWEFEGEVHSGYTYNDENNLSQDFVYNIMGNYVFIQTHNGCDARGGFSFPHLFSQKEEWGILDYSRYTIYCDGDGEESHWWDYDGGYENTECEIDLDKCEWIDWDDIEQEDLDTMREADAAYRLVLAAWEKQIPFDGIDNPRPTPPEDVLLGKILVRDGVAYCPECGGKLDVSCM